MEDLQWAVAIGGIAASVVTVFGGIFVAVAFWKMGGGRAQQNLNITLKDVAEAYKERLHQRDSEIIAMREEMTACKVRLEVVEREHKIDRDEWMEERINLKSEISALYRRLGMTHRDTDPDPETP